MAIYWDERDRAVMVLWKNYYLICRNSQAWSLTTRR